jgi:hypothetical protein
MPGQGSVDPNFEDRFFSIFGEHFAFGNNVDIEIE